MSRTPESLTDLFKQYLRDQMTAQVEGLGLADADGQVVPHEAAPVQPVDPRLAWNDALAVLPHFAVEEVSSRGPVPPEWPALVAGQEPAIALAFCLGNYPQLVRNLQPLLTGGDLTALRQASRRPVSAPPALLEWASGPHSAPQALLAAAVLRSLRHYSEAATLLRSQPRLSVAWEAVRANEEAALLWHSGRAEEALSRWQEQPASVPVLFNRGMAALFLGRTTDARAALTEATTQLPETNAWHHLGCLYLALANARG